MKKAWIKIPNTLSVFTTYQLMFLFSTWKWSNYQKIEIPCAFKVNAIISYSYKQILVFYIVTLIKVLLVDLYSVSLFKFFSFMDEFVENYFLYFSSLPVPLFWWNFGQSKTWVISNCIQKEKFQILIFREFFSILVKPGIPGKNKIA